MSARCLDCLSYCYTQSMAAELPPTSPMSWHNPSNKDSDSARCGGRRIKSRCDCQCDQGQAKSGSVVAGCIRPRTGGRCRRRSAAAGAGGTRPPETHLAPPQTNNPRTPQASPLPPLGRLHECSQGRAEPGAEHCSWGRVCPAAAAAALLLSLLSWLVLHRCCSAGSSMPHYNSSTGGTPRG